MWHDFTHSPITYTIVKCSGGHQETTFKTLNLRRSGKQNGDDLGSNGLVKWYAAFNTLKSIWIRHTNMNVVKMNQTGDYGYSNKFQFLPPCFYWFPSMFSLFLWIFIHFVSSNTFELTLAHFVSAFVYLDTIKESCHTHTDTNKQENGAVSCFVYRWYHQLNFRIAYTLTDVWHTHVFFTSLGYHKSNVNQHQLQLQYLCPKVSTAILLGSFIRLLSCLWQMDYWDRVRINVQE